MKPYTVQPPQGAGPPPVPEPAVAKAALTAELRRHTAGEGRLSRMDWRTVNRLLDELAEVIGHG